MTSPPADSSAAGLVGGPLKSTARYFSDLFAGVGRVWTEFWFTPSDPATLSVMRVLTGAVVLYLHATLSLDLLAFFGSEGLLPADQIWPIEAGTFSYLNYLSSPSELWTAHLIGLAILVLFTAGFWTRLTAALSLLVLLSDIGRAPMITGRTELIASMVMLYLCLAPCGRRYSLDAMLSRAGAPVATAQLVQLSTATTIATRLIQIHLALLVAMMGFSKLTSDAWWTGTGVWWLMARPESRLLDLTRLHAAPKVLEIWTHAIVFFEFAFPVLIWIPLARPLLLVAGVLIWTSVALITGDITFALMMCIASMAFIPPGVFRECCARRPPGTQNIA